MKAVMLSIQPKWCELIASGKKTIEVRKTAPKLETPFKCYIYCTKDTKKHYYIDEYGERQVELIPTKIIGEFVCDCIEEFRVFENGTVQYWNYHDLEKSCLTYEQIAEYIGNGEKGYAWHISDLKIYDEPKELGEFKVPCPQINAINGDCRFCKYSENSCFGKMPKCNAYLTRPLQSWGYVEELET